MTEISSPTQIAADFNQNPPANHELLPGEVLDRLVKTEIQIDQEDFLRHRFDVLDPQNPTDSLISVEFRGREELPVIEDETSNVHAVLSRDVAPLHTGMDRYGKWAESISGTQQDKGVILGEPTAETVHAQTEKIWGVAARNENSKVILHAPGTPAGVIDVAIQLVGAEVGLPNALGNLLKMRGEVSSRKYSAETLRLMKSMFAVCSELSQDGSHEAGLMLVALGLTGSEEARSAVEQAEVSFDHKRIAVEIGQRSTNWANGEAKDVGHIAEAGEQVDPEVIKKVKEAGLVAVHTTQTRPLMGRILRPTAEFNAGQNSQFPRDSVHFSLNHPVANHLWGQFSDRPFTVVTPLAGLLEANGAPAAMADVDTYFMSTPGEGLTLPDSTTIIESIYDDKEGPVILQEDGSWRINAASLHDPESIRSIAAEIKSMSTIEGYDYNKDNPVAYLASRITTYGEIDLRNRNHQAERFNPEDDWSFKSKSPEEQVVFLQELAEIKEIFAVYEAAGQYGNMEAILTDPELLKTNNVLNKILTEALRKVLVATAIKKEGGAVVKGGAHYVFDTEFQNLSNRIADEIGVSAGLHQQNPEAKFESTFFEALTKAQEKIQLGKESQVTDFNWTKYNPSSVWYWLSRSPAQARIRAIEMGILTFAKKKDLGPVSVTGKILTCLSIELP